MKHYFITKDKFGIKCREARGEGWEYLPDRYQGQPLAEVRKYFENDLRIEDLTISFTNNFGEKTTFYQVDKNKKFATLNLNEQILLKDEDFVPESEQVAFLMQFSDPEVDQSAKKLTSEWDKLRLLRLKAAPNDLENLKGLINERKTPEKIIEFCKAHAEKHFNSSAYIEY